MIRHTVDHGVFVEERVTYSGLEYFLASPPGKRLHGPPGLGSVAEAVAYRREIAETVLRSQGYSPEKSRAEATTRPDWLKIFALPWWSVPFDAPRPAKAASDVIRLGADLLEHRALGLEEATLLDSLLLGEAWLYMLVVLDEPTIKAAKGAVAAASAAAQAKADKRHGGEAGRRSRAKRRVAFQAWDTELREFADDLRRVERAEVIAKKGASEGWVGPTGAPLSVSTVLEILKGRR